MPGTKRRVYEAAKDMGMSSEALVAILKSLQVDVKSHMSSIGEEVVEQVRLKLVREKEAVKEEEARKKEKAVQAAKALADAQRRTAPALASAKTAKGIKKKKRAVDEKLIRASVRRTWPRWKAPSAAATTASARRAPPSAWRTRPASFA